jgi:hypothetical protein
VSVAVGDVIKVTARMLWAGAVDVQNVFYAQLSSGTTISDDDCKDDLTAWVESMYDVIDGHMPSSLAFVDLDYFNVTQDSPMGVDFWPVLTVGGGGTDIQATGVAAVITAFTTLIRTRGRKFFGPLTEAVVADGLIDSGVMIDLTSVGVLWITPFVGATSGETWTPGVWRRIATAFKAFRDGVVRNIPGYQRRRKQGVGS